MMLADFMHSADAWMPEPSCRPGFSKQTRRTSLRFVSKQLDRDLALQLVVVRTVDDSHAPFANWGEDSETSDAGRGG